MNITYDFHIARDGEMFASSYTAADEEDAQALALADINLAWRQDYTDFDDLVADSDGHSLYRRDDDGMVALYRALADGLSDMVGQGRLARSAIPDDYAWLVGSLADIAVNDPAAA